MALTPLSEALDQILATADAVPEIEWVSLETALWRYAAEPVTSGLAVPPADNSAMDGYAVQAATVPGELVISQRIPAGHAPVALEPGTAARIFTGAEIPPGADAVILQEDTESAGGHVRFPAAQPGQHIRRQGSDIRPGDELIPRGHCIKPQDVGLLASVGIDVVGVFRPLKVAVLTTGDELREPGSGELAPGQIFNSNRFSLGAQIQALGMIVADLDNIPDDPDRIGEALERAASVADCIVTA
ncbi:MAG: molybdopterin molybdotransferase MoeA, partial [Proteobacteria bacterium]|nr:molybdopterin molybdotransferase MoeA [Pseudomonadota bacterium]